MDPRRVWWALLSTCIMLLLACSPRYTSKQVAQPLEVGDKSQEPVRVLEKARDAYDRGVDFFVKDEFDSAGSYLEYAVVLLSSDVDWTQDPTISSERRILLYKCRYFIERLPAIVHEVAQPEEGVTPTKPPLPPVEIEYNSKVKKWIDYFAGSGKKTFLKWVYRSGKYRDLTERILAEEGLPTELANLALIESGFNPNAYSRAHAVGIWQFIKSTARIYGLRVDWWVDERRDPARACRAAARHLRDLYQTFDSWPLALAAYNCGQRNVERAIRRAHSRDFWRLRLKRETRDYVPKFMAACIIMQNPSKYGLNLTYAEPLEFDEIQVEPRTSLKALASACGVSLNVMRELNPHLIRGCAPHGKADYRVRVPAGMTEACRLALSQMPEEERLASAYTSPTIRHTVRRGETLSRIARKYSTTVRAIARANGIANLHRIRAGQVLVIPGGEYVPLPANPGIHIVRRGETLSSIARRYHVRVKDLVAWNDLKSAHVIYPGQRLIVSNEYVPHQEEIVHTVKRGETISQIAAKYGASTNAVLRANGLARTSKIYPGQKISVPVGPESTRGKVGTYVVKKGDTISEIAKLYGVSVENLLRINGLRARDKIYPGQRLKIAGSTSSEKELVVHKVKRGETLWSIARKYATSVEEIVRTNGLKQAASIYPGQRLKIVASGGGQTKVHTVRRGETITRIARHYGVPVRSVLEVNNLDADDIIYPGQRIRVPVRSGL